MYCHGYTGRLRTDYRDCFGGYRGRLHENPSGLIKTIWTEDTQGAVRETRIG